MENEETKNLKKRIEFLDKNSALLDVQIEMTRKQKEGFIVDFDMVWNIIINLREKYEREQTKQTT